MMIWALGRRKKDVIWRPFVYVDFNSRAREFAKPHWSYRRQVGIFDGEMGQ